MGMGPSSIGDAGGTRYEQLGFKGTILAKSIKLYLPICLVDDGLGYGFTHL